MITLFWKAAAGILISLILGLVLGKQEKDLSVLLTAAVSCMACGIALTFLEPVLEFLWELEALGDLHQDLLAILLRSAGIGLASEMVAMLCIDGGNTALAKTVQMLGTAAILCLSLPIFRTLLELIQKLLGDI